MRIIIRYKSIKCRLEHQSVTLYEKSLVIQDLNKGKGVTYLVKKYGVAKSTICKIKKKEIIFSAVIDTYVGFLEG